MNTLLLALSFPLFVIIFFTSFKCCRCSLSNRSLTKTHHRFDSLFSQFQIKKRVSFCISTHELSATHSKRESQHREFLTPSINKYLVLFSSNRTLLFSKINNKKHKSLFEASHFSMSMCTFFFCVFA